MYEYGATILGNVDGDTIHAQVDLGFSIRVDMTLRFAGINAPELGTPEGAASAAWVAGQVPPATKLVIHTAKDRHEKYGRMLAWLQMPDGSWLNQTMVDAGLAVPFGNLPATPPTTT